MSRLLILSYLDFPFYAGLSRRVEGLIKILSSRGINPIIISPIFRLNRPLPHKYNVIYIDLRKLIRIPLNANILKLVAIGIFSLVSLIYIIKLKLNNCLSIIQYESMYSFAPALIAKLIFNIKILGDDITFLIKKKFFNKVFEAFVLKYSDYIIVASPEAYSYVSNLRNRTLLIPNGVTISEFKFSEKIFHRIIFVGSLSYRENINAIKAIITISKTLKKEGVDYEILIIGGPQNRIFMGGIDQNIKFLGFVEQEEYTKILKSCYIGLLPFFQKYELGGQRIKALEYFSLGILTISTLEGVRGIRGLNPNKHFIKVSSIDEMSYKLVKVLKDPEKYLKIAKNGYRFIIRNYAWSMTTRQYGQLIESLLSSSLYEN